MTPPLHCRPARAGENPEGQVVPGVDTSVMVGRTPQAVYVTVTVAVPRGLTNVASTSPESIFWSSVHDAL